MRTRFLAAALASAILSFGVSTAMAQTTTAPADNQESSNPTKAPGKRTDPPSSTADRTANTPMAGAEATPAMGGSDAKPMHKKAHHHKKSKPTEPGGTNSAGDMSHSGVQSGGNDAATSTGNSQPGSSKQGQ